ncbi:D-alanine--D-alanine ligase [Tuberibacillus sp. Marseille-P3662]|uniref:D-alanine--D-alanine ligase n=1 Tax=Tuberibacillus sp. Marseille-P3662 TaxID=1965358 RepID=UPI000A1C9514|nr:D-alanine--D-alanine ligase [Tuberibacillus sp. Marseille-P3662]
MKIGVIYGGTSSERDVSLSTGKGIIQALKQNGYEVTAVDFHPDRLESILSLEVDLVFIALHGKYGEDGRIQGLLEILGIPYVGSGIMSSSLAMDKARAKVLFEQAAIRTAKGLTIAADHLPLQDSPLGYPVVIKPNSEGSTIGLTIAHDRDTFMKGINEAFKFDQQVLVEEFVSGNEITVSVIEEDKKTRALPVVEIVPKNQYYDYESKYAPGMSDHFVPARIPESVMQVAQDWAVQAHNILGCETYSRVDFIWPENDEFPVILEVNTLPGMTPTSLYPDAARAIGLSYEQMIDHLIRQSITSKQSPV